MKAEMNFSKLIRPLNAEQLHLLKNMKEEIAPERTDAVSFELFDTLILRPFFDRLDIALLMEKDFSSLYIGKKSFYELRTEAEERTLKKAKDKRCITLEDIYRNLEKISGISPSSREKLMKRECELEEYFCFARQCGRELYNTARKKRMKLIITADTYLPRQTVEKILERCGFNSWDKLYITGECNVPKAPDGQLFARICKDLGIPAHRLIHFGGSFEADAEAPVKQGSRSVFLTTCRDRLIKSGQLCGFIQKELIYDFCSEKYLALRCILALYAAYSFDYPQKRIAQSDFCGDDYMLGFIVLGALSVYKDFVVSEELTVQLLSAMSKNEKMKIGRDDFSAMFAERFGGNLEKYGFNGCALPFEYYLKHGAIGDRMSVQGFLSADVMEKWSQGVTEPEIAPVYTGEAKISALSKLADRLFPPNTQIRTYVDGILSKLR